MSLIRASEDGAWHIKRTLLGVLRHRQAVLYPLRGVGQGTKRQVKVLEAGGFFGEVALINHAPRAADCVAASKLKAGTLPVPKGQGAYL